MEIQVGKNYVNKTWRFLLPCLRGHGDIFIKKFNPVFKFAVGIHDTLLDGNPLSDTKNIYLLCDKLYQPRYYEEFLNWVRNQPFYVHDYCPDADITKSRKHIIGITIPERFSNAYDMFLEGKYSQMYTTEEINVLFANSERVKERDVLLKSVSLHDEFIKSVNLEFNTDISIEDIIHNDIELELPPKLSQEVFHYKAGERVFFLNEYK